MDGFFFVSIYSTVVHEFSNAEDLTSTFFLSSSGKDGQNVSLQLGLLLFRFLTVIVYF